MNGGGELRFPAGVAVYARPSIDDVVEPGSVTEVGADAGAGGRAHAGQRQDQWVIA